MESPDNQPSLAAIPLGVREKLPEDWVPPEPPEGSPVDPGTYQTLAAWAEHNGPAVRRFLDKQMPLGSTATKQGRLDADDLLQEAFLSILKGKYGTEGLPPEVHTGFLMGTARNKLTDARREKARSKEDTPGDLRDSAAEAQHPENIVIERLVTEQVIDLAEKLSVTGAQRMIMLAALEDPGIGGTTLAQLTGLTVGSTRVAKTRVFGKLRARLQEADPTLLPPPHHVHKSKREKPADVPPSLPALRQEVLGSLSESRKQGLTSLRAVLPTYLGGWQVVARDMQNMFKGSEHTPHGMIVYPHQVLVPKLIGYMRKHLNQPFVSAAEALGEQSENGLIIDTPENLAAAPELAARRFDYVATLGSAATVLTDKLQWIAALYSN